MKILVLSIEFPPVGGGAAPVIHELCKQSIRLGYQVTIVTMQYKNLPDYEVMDGIEIYRINCLRIKKHISYFHEHIAFIIAAKYFLKKLLKTKSFDVCHAHFLVPTGILARWLWKKYQMPYIITCHGSDLPGFNPDRFYFLHRFTPALIRSIIHHSRFIVAPSRYLLTLIEMVLANPSNKLRHIPNGINTDQFIPGLKKPMILSTGRLLPRKGFQYLIEAVSTEKFPMDVHLCGDGPMKSDLVQLALRSKTPVVFHGWLDNRSDEYKKLVSEASVYCLVSAHENASIALLEALSSGCAVITSNVTGCPESVGEAGICIPPADVEELHKQLKMLSDHPEEMQRLMHAARERAIHEFSWESIAAKYIALYNQASLT